MTIKQIKHNPELSNIIGTSYLNVCGAYVDWPSRSEKLKSDYKLPEWELLHGFWRTIPNFNPHMVSSEPSQDLGAKAQDLLFPSRGNGDASGAEEPDTGIEGDEDEDMNLLDMVEGAAGLMDVDIDIGLRGYNDAPDKVRRSTIFVDFS